MITATVVVGLVSYRVWRLAAVDQITEPLRARIIYGDSRVLMWFSNMLVCAWCFGAWVALAMAAAWIHTTATGWEMLVPLWLASSTVVGFLDLAAVRLLEADQ